METIRAVLGWLVRRTALFALLVAALVAHQLLAPSFQSHRELRASVERLRRDREVFERLATSEVGRSDAAVAHAQGYARGELDGRIGALRRERAELRSACSGDGAAFLRGGPEKVIANRVACLRGALVEREITALEGLRDTVDLRRRGESPSQAVRRRTTVMHAAADLIRRIDIEEKRLVAEPLGEFRHKGDLAKLRRSRQTAAEKAAQAQSAAERLLTARRRAEAAETRFKRAVRQLRAELGSLVASEGRRLDGTVLERLRGWAKRVDLSGKMRQAAVALLGIIAAPYLIRTFLFHAVAPVVARRRAIRVGPPGGAPIPPAPRSAASVSVAIGPGEELLVRQGYLQTSGAGGSKRTRWLLDPRRPFASWAAGLVFLTRIRGAGERVTVSAVRDPFAEVAVLTLPEGAACVLTPRALAAVAQPIGRPLRIASRWRLRSLHAWATLRLRHLVFHGPARLVVKGGRGVRVEPAERGRVFGREQLVGFSADLAYSVTRVETFWPYFFGREPLFRDRVADGGGVLLVEEAPLAGRRGGVGRGLEGVVDAMLKVVGV